MLPSLELIVENDSLGAGDTTDRGYTHGVMLELTLEPTPEIGELVRRLPFIPRASQAPHLTLRAGQQTFTPEDITTSRFQPDDRPYAAWSFVGFTARALTPGDPDTRRDRLDAWSLRLGLVGPSSQGDEIQIAWHELWGYQRPNGWRHQLDDEVAGDLAYTQRRRLLHQPLVSELASDLELAGQARLGTVHTDAALGLSARLGWNLPRDFGAPLRAPGDDGSPSLFATLGGELRAVARELWLDGNTWQDSHSVDREPLVGELRLGLEGRLGPLRLTYVHVFRSSQFDGPDGQGGAHDYASLRLSVAFDW